MHIDFFFVHSQNDPKMSNQGLFLGKFLTYNYRNIGTCK